MPPNSSDTPCLLSIAIAASVSSSAFRASLDVVDASSVSHAAFPSAVDARFAKNIRASSHPAEASDFSSKSRRTASASFRDGPNDAFRADVTTAPAESESSSLSASARARVAAPRVRRPTRVVARPPSTRARGATTRPDAVAIAASRCVGFTSPSLRALDDATVLTDARDAGRAPRERGHARDDERAGVVADRRATRVLADGLVATHQARARGRR
jgi:hypothetical protein